MLLLARPGTGSQGGAAAEAIDFDGTNDYLSRSSDLTGNTDSKTFTFSAWVWWAGSANLEVIYLASTAGDSQYGLDIYISDGGAGQPRILAKNAAGTTILRMDSGVYFSKNTFNHFLISVDLANTANRYVYINDVLTSPTWVTYTNDSIDNTRQYHGVGASGATGNYKCLGRLSNVFLDYTYRNLSIEANRRLFVTADLNPAAGQAALNPILYLPMDDPTAPGVNAGTGGNFTLTGTVARSGRGPNQYNAPYSDLDGSADYLSRTTAPTGIFDNSSFTVHCAFVADSVSTAQKIVFFGSDASNRFQVAIDPSGQISLQGYNASGTQLLGVTTVASIVAGRNYVLDVSVELFNPSARHFFINGQAASATWNVYTGGFIDFNIATTPRYHICANTNTGSPSQFFNGRLGALWFDISYIDLSVAANLAKFVTGTGIDAKPVDPGASGELPTGTSPLIYLPMYGNNAGKNYGTGGDFTVNSGPFTGARGPNEFWGNWVYLAESGTITRSSTLAGASSGGTASFVFSFWPNQVSSNKYILTANGDTFTISFDGSSRIYVWAKNSSGTTILFAYNNTTITTGSRYTVFLSFDLSNTSNRYFSVNGSTSTTWSTYTSGTIPYSTVTNWRFFTNGATGNYDGRLGEFYFTTTYIDFSQEANRLKFYDAFNNPCNLPSAITAETIPNPAIYMRFNPTSLGTNSGTGGNFTPSGTFYDLGQF